MADYLAQEAARTTQWEQAQEEEYVIWWSRFRVQPAWRQGRPAPACQENCQLTNQSSLDPDDPTLLDYLSSADNSPSDLFAINSQLQKLVTSSAFSPDPQYQMTTYSIIEKLLLSQSRLIQIPDYYQLLIKNKDF